MRKILFLLTLILMLDIVLAEDLEINLIEYHPDTYYSRLQIRNNAGRDLNDLIIKIGDAFETSSQGIFKNGANYNAILNIPPGEHMVTVSTKEGVSSSKLVYFSLSQREVQEQQEIKVEEKRRETEIQELAEKNLEEAGMEIEKEREKAIQLGIEENGNNTLLIVGIIALVVGIIILFWLIKRGKNE